MKGRAGGTSFAGPASEGGLPQPEGVDTPRVSGRIPFQSEDGESTPRKALQRAGLKLRTGAPGRVRLAPELRR